MFRQRRNPNEAFQPYSHFMGTSKYQSHHEIGNGPRHFCKTGWAILWWVEAGQIHNFSPLVGWPCVECLFRMENVFLLLLPAHQSCTTSYYAGTFTVYHVAADKSKVALNIVTWWHKWPGSDCASFAQSSFEIHYGEHWKTRIRRLFVFWGGPWNSSNNFLGGTATSQMIPGGTGLSQFHCGAQEGKRWDPGLDLSRFRMDFWTTFWKFLLNFGTNYVFFCYACSQVTFLMIWGPNPDVWGSRIKLLFRDALQKQLFTYWDTVDFGVIP